MLRDPPHYLRPLLSTTTPRRLVWLDCQAQHNAEQGMVVDRWDLGAIGRTWWTSKRGERRDTMRVHRDAAVLWAEVAEFCRPGKRAVLWAYDLAYQLRVSRGLVHLPQLGFRLDRIVLERTAAWALFRSGKRTLLCCDLKSWAPVELTALEDDLQATGAILALDPTLPRDGGPGAVRRAEVIREATLQILAWIEAEGLGPFRPTGSGQSYAAFRRRFHATKVLVHDDTARLELERAGMWTGRCEAWRHGTIIGGPFIEYDLRAAYATIAAGEPVPAIAQRPATRPSPARLDALLDRGAVLAECEITATRPLVPARMGDRTVWPVGSFRTVLWDPELRLALAHAESVKVTRAWPYTREPVLVPFSQWVLDGLGDQTQLYGLIPRRVLKHWSRCLVGRLGLRYRQWQRFGYSPEPDLRLITYVDLDAGTSTDLLCAGYDRMILAAMSEALESLPQIPGWVMSECRARLWRAMTWAGLDRVLYVDTDSMILDLGGLAGAELLDATLKAAGWSVKGRYDRLTIHGPRNLSTETGRRISGLPITARQVAPLEFTGQVMRSIKESMRAGELDNVAHVPRKFVLDAPDLRRDHLPGGITAPYQLEVLPDEPRNFL